MLIVTKATQYFDKMQKNSNSEQHFDCFFRLNCKHHQDDQDDSRIDPDDDYNLVETSTVKMLFGVIVFFCILSMLTYQSIKLVNYSLSNGHAYRTVPQTLNKIFAYHPYGLQFT